ncbi:hypothetical protein AX15_002163 [Amanita polypyramis BW_CC]|nr:hypothetical protein AX15_002163 [Amanita polypyramis BW_CC]
MRISRRWHSRHTDGSLPTHSFPGGRMDEADASLPHAALRETQEELGIDPKQVDVLGNIGPPELLRRGELAVWPFVGFVHSSPSHNASLTKPDDPLPSLNVNTIRGRLPTTEVAAAFHLPFSAMIDPTRRRSRVRVGKSYEAIAVADLLETDDIKRSATVVNGTQEADCTMDNSAIVDGDNLEGLEVWGLTGWYLTLFMKALKIIDE